jgi:hypothetical protein
MKLNLILCGVLCAAAAARAELPPETVRAIHEAHKDSVLMLSGTLKFQAQKLHEIQVAGPATVVDTNGLLITAVSTVRLPMSARKTEIRESTLKIKLPSGAELPVRVVLTDADLGAVLLAPENPAAVPAGAFQPVDWATAAQAQRLDPVVIVGRTEKAYGGLPDSAPGKINAVDRKPRLLYICALLASGDGEAAFDRAGRLLGIGLGAQTIVAAEELQDVIEQARRAAARSAAQKPAADKE